jgi:hypothetical protein
LNPMSVFKFLRYSLSDVVWLVNNRLMFKATGCFDEPSQCP